MFSDDNFSDSELSSYFTTKDESSNTIDVSSDDDSVIGHRRKRLSVETKSSESSSSSETEDLTLIPILQFLFGLPFFL